MEAKAAIDKIYADFKAHWGEDNYPNLFRAFERMEEEDSNNHQRKKYPHKLGHYAIFYTPVFYPPAYDHPEYMIIGDSPSWFDSNAKSSPTAARDAEEEVIRLGKKPPSKNLYLTGDFKFGDEMKYVFDRRPHILEKAVGLNRLWIQAGGDYDKFVDDISKNCAAEEFKCVQKTCKYLTQKIVSILKPKTVFLFGGRAQRAFPKTVRRSLSPCKFENIIHPSNRRGSVHRTKEEMNDYFDRCHPPFPENTLN